MNEQQPSIDGDQEGSITLLLGALKSGDSAAVEHLWQRYFNQLVLFAHGRLRRTVPGGIEDEEDAALSALESFFKGAQDGRFPRLADRDNLWQVLVMITKRKIIDQLERRNAEKRGGAYRRVEGGLDWLSSPGRTPEFIALVADECRVLLDLLSSEDPTDRRQLRAIALWKLEGFTNEEISAKIGCAVRTVANRLDLIRKIWDTEGHQSA
jgi:DNA-directed RNA polymerase specialized sigma24 family protein